MTNDQLAERTPKATDAALTVRGLRVMHKQANSSTTILSGVDLTLAAGETIGIVGESGSGKTVTARAISGLLPRALIVDGEVRFNDQEMLKSNERLWRGVRGSGIGMVLQDPFTMLSPTRRCSAIIIESLRNGRDLSRSEKRAEAARRLAEVGITDASVLDRYPFQLSGGMRQRVGIAAALAGDPSLLVADEPSTALDVTTQRDILQLLKRIQAARGMGLALITHDLRVAFAMCDRIYVFYAGTVVEVGLSQELDARPLHPYTLGLLLSEPPMSHKVERLTSIPGSVPSPDDVSDQCRFAARCKWAAPECTAGAPPLIQRSLGRETACVRIAEIESEMVAERARATQEAHPPVVKRAAEALIGVRHMTKVFPGAGTSVPVLQDVSLEINAGESVGLVGQSGSGKTTMSRLLVGLENITSGEVVIDGVSVTDWRKLGPRDMTKVRRTVQIVFQDPYSSLNPSRTIGWTLAEAITLYSATKRGVEGRVKELLASVGLSAHHAGLRPAALSGGMRQRVAIARALAVEPKVLICDEPVSALDVSVQAQILNLLASLRSSREIGYLFVTHDLSVVRQVADYLYVMHQGRIVESGRTEAVLDDPQDPYTVRLMNAMPRADVAWLTQDSQHN